jgi:cysteate synthase
VSHGLAKRVGLKALHIAFSGFWPERGAMLLTRSFREFEAQSTMARYLSHRAGQGDSRAAQHARSRRS